jgi:hypothetical protein
MDNLWVALDCLNNSFFAVDILSRYLVCFETMDFQINVLNFALKTFTVFFDNFEIKVIVMHWLSFFDVFLVLQDIGE